MFIQFEREINMVWAMRKDLASDGSVGADLGVAIRNKLEINDRSESIIIEEVNQFIDNEI